MSSQQNISEGKCSQCGICCTYIPIAFDAGLNEIQRHYLDVRCSLREGRWWLVKCPCKYLIEDGDKMRCGCYDIRPDLCRMYDGHDYFRKYHFWVPKNCTLVVKDE